MKIEVLKTEDIPNSKSLKVKVFLKLGGDEESNTSKFFKKG